MTYVGGTVLCVLAVALCRCGQDGADISGRWTGNMTDADGARSVSGNCTQSGSEARCTFTVSDPARGSSSPAVLAGEVSRNPMSTSGTISFGLGVTAPPCSINVSGTAALSTSSIDGDYAGTDTCGGGTVRGRLALTRS